MNDALEQRGAIVHDWFQGFHGSERVVAALLGVFAHPPDVFTFQAEPEVLPAFLSERIVRQSRIARLPGVRQRGHSPGRWRWLLPYMPHWFRSLSLDDYPVVIASSHACAVQAKPPDDALYACYCHTPMRYVWMPDTDHARVTGVKGVALRTLAGRLRESDRRAAQRPDLYMANSTAVAERIEHFYGRSSEVVYPPVAVDDFDWRAEKEPGHLLWVHRLVPYKRPLEVARAFASLPDLRLTMVGVGPLDAELRASAPPNVTVRGWIDRDELAGLYARASGFVHVAAEDFGISMVEALAAGCPVLALDEGGARDIVRDGVDGILLAPSGSEKDLVDGLRALSEMHCDPADLRARAEEFSEVNFQARVRKLLVSHGAH